ncbi:MAG: type II toxin-antitoxin system RelE/ParE family toxin [Pseudomonadota bacterium]
MYSIVHYLDSKGKDYYQDWLDSIRDRQAKIAIIRRIARLGLGLAGDRKSLRGGVQELRIDVGPGYRVYFGFVASTVVLLTSGGNKQSQQQDIEFAIKLLQEWKARNGKNSPFA